MRGAEAGDTSRNRLKLLLAPALGLLHAGQRLRIAREQRRVRPALIEHASDLSRALHAPIIELERGHGSAAKAHEPQVHSLAQRQHVDELELDVFALEHLARRLRGVGDRHPIQAHSHPSAS